MENLVQMAMHNVNFGAIMPPLVLCCFGMALLLISVFSPRGKTGHVALISLVALAVTAVVSVAAWGRPQFGFAGHVRWTTSPPSLTSSSCSRRRWPS